MRAQKHLSSHLYTAFPYMTQLFFHFLMSKENNNFTRKLCTLLPVHQSVSKGIQLLDLT